MSTSRPPEFDMERFLLISQGHAAFQYLWAADQLRLFNSLSDRPGLTREEISEKLDLPPQSARILISGLLSLGIVTENENQIYNAPFTEEKLVHGKDRCFASVLGWQYHIVYPGLMHLTKALKTGKNVGLDQLLPFQEEPHLYGRLTHVSYMETAFQDSMAALSNQANIEFLDTVDLSGVNHLMDVGGGRGNNAIAFTKRNPHLKVTIFDSESICEGAKDNIKAAGLEDRIDTYPGDLLTTPFPEGPDGIIYCHMFTIFSAETNQKILQKTYDALPDGGRAIIFNMMTNDDEAGPISCSMGHAYFLTIATGEGMLWSWKDYQNWFEQAGFSKFERIEGLPVDHGIFVATK